jgi:hypothetical protein
VWRLVRGEGLDFSNLQQPVADAALHDVGAKAAARYPGYQGMGIQPVSKVEPIWHRLIAWLGQAANLLRRVPSPAAAIHPLGAGLQTKLFVAADVTPSFAAAGIHAAEYGAGARLVPGHRPHAWRAADDSAGDGRRRLHRRACCADDSEARPW